MSLGYTLRLSDIQTRLIRYLTDIRYLLSILNIFFKYFFKFDFFYLV